MRTDGKMSSRPIIFEGCPRIGNERRGRTTLCRPVQSFLKGARTVRIKDEDGWPFVILSRPAFSATCPLILVQAPGIFRRILNTRKI